MYMYQCDKGYVLGRRHMGVLGMVSPMSSYLIRQCVRHMMDICSNRVGSWLLANVVLCWHC